ncbi:MAG: hypothetical protein IPI46_13735 [Bacteroidetes bacterium]|nr:hypothetical protein [Bacteroidota bacterium]
MSIKIRIAFFLIFIPHFSMAKPTKEIQIGVSYNTMKWEVYTGILPKTIYRLNSFNTQPLIRFGFTSKHKKNFSLHTFLSYHVSGGKFRSDTSNFKEKYTMHSIELGAFLSYKIVKNTSIGIGLKANYLPLSYHTSYGTVNQSDTLPRKWVVENVRDKFMKLSTNAGFAIKHQHKKISFSWEAWFGLLPIGNMNTMSYRADIIENNYRLIVGYRI